MQKKLNDLLQHSHSQYSQIKVSSIVIANGKEYKGVNVENASFGATNCAERTAMFSAIADGNKPGSITEIHIASSLDRFLYPCGLCLQVMSELGSENLKIVLHSNEEIKECSLKELMPKNVNKGSFGWK